jgi:Domain of unknown function (DUF222)
MGLGPSSDSGTGAVPGRGPGQGPGVSVLARAFGFGRGGVWDKCAPSAALAIALEEAASLDLSCPGASRDEQVGILKQWAALESYAAAGRLGALRAMTATEDQPDPQDKSLAYEAAQALAVSVPTAQAMMALASDLHDRLPGIEDLLTSGLLAYAKARAVSDVFACLSPEDAAAAEALILDELPGKNYGQVLKLAQQAALTVDPDSATRRREDAEREQARVNLFREDSGAAGLSLSGRLQPHPRGSVANQPAEGEADYGQTEVEQRPLPPRAHAIIRLAVSPWPSIASSTSSRNEPSSAATMPGRILESSNSAHSSAVFFSACSPWARSRCCSRS